LKSTEESSPTARAHEPRPAPEQLEDIRRRSLRLEGLASPYLIHRAPDRARREWTEGKPHWTYVNPGYLTKAFAEVRDTLDSNRYSNLAPHERPTFHEIRGLGARIYRAKGVAEASIQALMTHSNKRTTRIYLERGSDVLADDDYVAVAAPLTLQEMVR
jgi:integrase